MILGLVGGLGNDGWNGDFSVIEEGDRVIQVGRQRNDVCPLVSGRGNLIRDDDVVIDDVDILVTTWKSSPLSSIFRAKRKLPLSMLGNGWLLQ